MAKKQPTITSTTKIKRQKLRTKLQKKPPPLKPEKDIKTNNSKSQKNPDVIVDFEYDKSGLLFVIIENIGNDSAYDTSVKFSRKILGLQKTKNISSMKIFQLMKFLPPGKKISVLIDSFQFYLLGKQPLQVKTIIKFNNKSKQKFENSIHHDLSIYKDMAEIFVKKET